MFLYNEDRKNRDFFITIPEKIKYNFHKFGDIFDRTNYFENYKFEWFE